MSKHYVFHIPLTKKKVFTGRETMEGPVLGANGAKVVPKQQQESPACPSSL